MISGHQIRCESSWERSWSGLVERVIQQLSEQGTVQGMRQQLLVITKNAGGAYSISMSADNMCGNSLKSKEKAT